MEHCNVNDVGMTQYQIENQELADYFLSNFYFDNWRRQDLQKEKNPHFIAKTIELIISPLCNLGCRYCYMHKFRRDIFNPECYDTELTLKNLKKILTWMAKNEFNCSIDLFSGEILAQQIGYDILELLYQHEKSLPEYLRNKAISIPTNFTFICSDELTEKVYDYYTKFEELGIVLGLSASFDGKYMEENRPHIRDLDLPITIVRDDAYYDKCFAFVRKIKGGFHPMIYSRGIENWKKNFLWFQEQFKKHDIPWDCLYLLHVRNEEWNNKQIQELGNFIEWLWEWLWDKVDHNPERFMEQVSNNRCFNILTQQFTQCGRGLTCSIQNNLVVRVSDLAVYPCHRLGYNDLHYGYFVEDDEQLLRFVNKNIELHMAVSTIHKEALPMCSQCPINKLCIGPCLGACYESNNNMFAPIPSVCAISHMLGVASIKGLKKIGMYRHILEYVMPDFRTQILYLEEEVNLNVE